MRIVNKNYLFPVWIDLAMVIAWQSTLALPVYAQTLNSFGRKPSRIVHQFDFDERVAGNLEDLPKYWEPLRPRHFPHYTVGKFDFEVGHRAKPSFHLSSEGRHVAYQYVGPDTRILTNTD